MITAGIDIGSTTTKAVIMDGNDILSNVVIPSSYNPAESSLKALQDALKNCSLDEKKIDSIATTGYGRRLLNLQDNVLTEIKACAYGIKYFFHEDECINSIIDVGGQDTKIIILNELGDVDDFAMNDKCAAGTGRFLEMLSNKLGLSFDDFVNSALSSDTMIQINSTCAVFAESEIISLLAKGIKPSDIARATHNAMAERIGSMCRRIGLKNNISFTGGGAKNKALIGAIEEVLNCKLYISENPQIIAAIGAAVYAQDRLKVDK